MKQQIKSLLALVCLASSTLTMQAQDAEQLAVADAFEFSVRTDYTADGLNALSRPYESRFGVEGWDRHMALALVLTSDIEQAATVGQTYKAPQETTAAATPAQPVVYMTTAEGYQNVTFFSSDMQFAYVLYFAPEAQRSWLLVSRIGGGSIQPLYQLSNDVSLLREDLQTQTVADHAATNLRANVDAFVSLTGRLASGQYHGINYIEK